MRSPLPFFPMRGLPVPLVILLPERIHLSLSSFLRRLSFFRGRNFLPSSPFHRGIFMYILKYGIKNTTECLLINRIYLIYSNLVLTGTSIRLCILSLRISAKDPYPTLHTFLSDFCEGYSKCCFESETGSYYHISAQHCILPLRVSAKGHLPTLHTLPFGFLRRLMKKIF